MTPTPGDLVVLNTTAIAWAEVTDGVFEIPDPWEDSVKVQVLRGEHGLVRRTLGLVAFVFWSRTGKSGIIHLDQLTVVGRPLPQVDLTRAFRSRTG